MRDRLLSSLESLKISNAPIDKVNETQVPLELRSASGGRAWLLPESMWLRLQAIAQTVSAATEEREE